MIQNLLNWPMNLNILHLNLFYLHDANGCTHLLFFGVKEFSGKTNLPEKLPKTKVIHRFKQEKVFHV